MKMDYLVKHLNERMQETEEAIAKYSDAVARDERFIIEFDKTSPETAQFYRDLKIFEQEKVNYFQEVLQDLQNQLAQRANTLG
jgi:hypothetical protein